jgi:hypothetical protein
MMRRREFIGLIGVAAATWPLGVGAQQPNAQMPTIAFVTSGTPADNPRSYRSDHHAVIEPVSYAARAES